jgi:ubiquinone/menaquinone biosynthesis C-methylase UbiE
MPVTDPATQVVVSTYKRLSSDYDQIIAQQPFFINCYALYEKLLDQLLTNRRFEKILDVGCGPGGQTVRLAEHGAEVVGVDIADDLLAVAKARCQAHPHVKFLKEDARALSFEGKTFDAIFSYGDVLSHIVEGYERAISEMSRVAKPGALITFEVDNKWHPGIFYHPFELLKNLLTPGCGHTARQWEDLHFKTFTYREMKKLLQKYGLEIEEYHGHNILAAIIPDRYVLENDRRSIWGRLALWLGKIDLALSDRFPFNRFGFNSIIIARKK